VLGYINHHHTVSEFQVRPYVGVMPWPYELKLDEIEVVRAFTIPLNWLAQTSNYRIEERRHPDSRRPWPIVYYDLCDGEMLWGEDRAHDAVPDRSFAGLVILFGGEMTGIAAAVFFHLARD
jgi:hypothetical protein